MEKISFDNDCSNIEDRIWGEKMISEGYKIIYDPSQRVSSSWNSSWTK